MPDFIQISSGEGLYVPGFGTSCIHTKKDNSIHTILLVTSSYHSCKQLFRIGLELTHQSDTCSGCLAEKPLEQFKSKTGNRTFKTCSTCREKRQDQRTAKRKNNEADVSEPPVEDTHTIEESQQASTSSPAPSFHFRGAHSQDTSQVADARRRREQDRRAHRAARRAGEDVPPTQDLDTYLLSKSKKFPLLLNNHSHQLLGWRVKFCLHQIPSLSRSSTSSLPPYRGRGSHLSFGPQMTPRRTLLSNHFICTACHKPRHPSRRIAEGVDTCQYCQDLTIPEDQQYQVCVSGDHEPPKSAFIDDHGIEHDISNSCLTQFVTPMDTDPSFHPISSAASSQPRRPRETNRRASRTIPRHDLNQPDPPYVPGDPGSLSQPALTETDWGYITAFHNALQQHRMERCIVCDEKWFNMRLTSDNICARCVNADRNQDTPLYGVANNLNPGDMPDLPELSQTEEMLIARVHVFVEVRRVRGQQYKYSGHVVNFLRDTARVYNTLPLLPRNLEIILLRPANASTDPRLQRQFIHDFRVRRERVLKWLSFLRQNHPGYRDIEISTAALELLPLDGDVVDQVINKSLDPVQISDSADTEVIEPPEVCAVPDLLAQEDEMSAIRNQLQPEESCQQHMEFPPFRSTPIAEFTRSQPLLSWAFPALFPRGEGEYIHPRQRTVSFADYAKHLMKFHDGRFARHPRFRYVVFNTMMRQQANTKASFFVKQKTKDGREITADDLRLAFEDDAPEGEALLNSITRRSGTLRGTRPFWTSKHQHLKAMVKNIGPSHLFVTLSAADLHWADLMRHLPDFEQWKAGTSSERIQIARDNLRDNPHIVAQWFSFDTIHFEKRFWTKDSMSLRTGIASNGKDVARYITMVYTGLTVLPIQRSNLCPSNFVKPSLTFGENTVRNCSATANRVERHICSEKYGLRKEKGSDVISCRFHFPHELRTEPFVDRAPGHQYYRFYPIRNDAMINAWNPCILMGWLANIGIAPCTGSKALLDYIAKYASKAEKKTESYKDTMKGFLPKLNPQNPFLLLRICINVDCRPEEVHSAAFVPVEPEIEGDETVQRGLSPLEKYKRRFPLFEDLSYFTFLREFDFRNWRQIYKRDAPARVLNYFPLYDSDKQPEDYARVKLMMHHPFPEIKDLLEIDGDIFESYAAAYEFCSYAHVHEDDFYDEVLTHPEATHEDSDSEDEEMPQSWEALARQLPNRDDATRVEDPDNIGDRTVDREMDWTPHVGRHSELEDNFWMTLKADNPADMTVESSASYEGLEIKQRQIYDVVCGHYQMQLNGEDPPHTLINLDGRAGTGKSHVLMFISATLDRIAEDAGLEKSPVIRAAPTGVAAYKHHWLYTSFAIPSSNRCRLKGYLTPENRQALQAIFRGVSWLIIDEKSMIGLKQVYYMNQRLQEIFPASDSESVKPFGGLNIILAGDFYQLPPVGQRALYYNKKLDNLEEIHGRALYHDFRSTIELDVIRRQEGADPTSIAFRDALDHLRIDQLTFKDWELLCTRIQAMIPTEAVNFKDDIRLYSKKAEVREYNHKQLRDIGNPVLRILATHQGLKADKASTEEAGNLHSEIHVNIGCRVMLLENIWTQCGLVNGAIGTVMDVIWHSNVTNPRETPPFALLIHFDTYKGPEFCTVDGKKVVTIFRSKRDFAISNINCSRTQFPITVAYAITVHKSQGITVPKAVLNISERDFAVGLTYVALSRAKNLDGIMFEEPFDFEKFKRSKPNPTMVMRHEDAKRRAEEHHDYIPLPPQPPSVPQSQVLTIDLPIRTSSPQRETSVIPWASSQTPPDDETDDELA
ncbi:conserved hypothetical protein [Talaromyces stipitatus ATCC 10500]|uniref:ATP-dependent DNA helicase n=1 Tax=Talaromyces stipitatus (strain ATCC 10500 / CBS 375.48 / QM 6759 / NRRL 1006) TaxID=441959 RepID=B8MPV7_TALSN|nr:uncharacterized protein TSTA_052860 [Talaromyces stipitatus ATCC 10500]EED12765.1 conserved hypothetical protein [Talaromyces stipitatus ATCC 10500]